MIFPSLEKRRACLSYIANIANQAHRVPWRKISDARNFIQHEYFSLDLDIVWQTISYEFAPLRAQIEEILKTEFPGGTTSA